MAMEIIILQKMLKSALHFILIRFKNNIIQVRNYLQEKTKGLFEMIGQPLFNCDPERYQSAFK